MTVHAFRKFLFLVFLSFIVTACGGGSSSSQQSGGGSTPTPPAGPALVSIAVGPPSDTVAVGLTRQLTATGIYQDGTKQDISSSVTWSSSATAVATISNSTGLNGLATAMSPGVTSIGASLGVITGSTTLNVTAATLVQINVTPAVPTLAVGSTVRFNAIGIFTDNSTQDLSASVTWSSVDPSVATVSNAAGSTGAATAIAAGTTRIGATLGAISGQTTLTVSGASLVSITVSAPAGSFAKGTTLKFTAIGLYTDHSTQDLTPVVAWSSSNAAIATIANSGSLKGTATGVAQGAFSLSATLGGVTGSANGTVTAATLSSIGITPAARTVPKGGRQPFTAVGTYTDQSTQNLTAAVMWTSSDSNVATVSNAAGSEGLVVAVNQGIVTLGASLAGVTANTSVTVSAATLVSLGVTPTNPTIANGSTRQFTATGVYSDNGTQDLTAAVAWTSGNSSVAVISNSSGTQGLATATASGSSVINAAIGNISGTSTLTVSPNTLTSISVSPANASLGNGATQAYTATGHYSDNSTQDLTTQVTWSVSAGGGNASISNASGSQGLATTTAQGNATIEATKGSIVGTTTLTVTAATLVSIGVTPVNPSLANGTSQHFIATGTYTDQTQHDLTNSVTWSSSAPAIAAISNAAGSVGLATTAQQGATTISAVQGSVSGSTGLTVTAATLVSLSVSPASSAVAKNSTQPLHATGTFTDGSTQDETSAVTWSSSDSTVAAISNATGSNGLVTGVAAGNVTLTAITGSVSASAALTVRAGAYAYVANYGDTTLSQYSIGADGSLTPLNTPTVANVGRPFAVAVDPTNRFVYAVNYLSNSVSQFTIGADGSLSPMNPSTVTTDTGPNNLAIDPQGHYLYVANYDAGTVNIYLIGASGALQPASVPRVTRTGGPAAVAVDPSGRYVYVPTYTGAQVGQFALGTGGVLSALNPAAVAAGSQANAIVVEPSGHYVYVADSGAASVSQYALGSDGTLSPLATATVAAGNSPFDLTVDPSGRFVYVANESDNTISQYAIGTGGTLAPLTAATAPSGSNPSSITVDASGHFAYATNRGGGSVSQFSVGNDGSLTPLTAPTVTAGSSPTTIATTH